MGVPGDVRVSGVPPEADQVSGKRDIEAETCWSKEEIPSEAKRQRGTLNTETAVFVSRDLEFLFLHYSKTARNLYRQSRQGRD